MPAAPLRGATDRWRTCPHRAGPRRSASSGGMDLLVEHGQWRVGYAAVHATPRSFRPCAPRRSPLRRRFHTDRLDTVGASPVGGNGIAEILAVPTQIQARHSVHGGAGQAFEDEVDAHPQLRSPVPGDPGRQGTHRSESQDGRSPAERNRRILHGLPGGRQYVGRVDDRSSVGPCGTLIGKMSPNGTRGNSA